MQVLKNHINVTTIIIEIKTSYSVTHARFYGRPCVARLIVEVEVHPHPRTRCWAGPLMNLQLRAIETTNLERRLARVEELLADKDELNSTGGAPGADVIQHRKPPRKA